ncbi:MAG TPA: hypothetical protein VEJ39_10960, partial [Candidatus Acidoferrales bacterium]|nr:hypothetical protein [Candidatus Acidoferrales bacterium]
ESYELSRLNAAANLRRELFELADRWIEAEVDSRLARWVLQHRGRNPDLRIDDLVALDSPDQGTKRLPPPRRSSNAKRAFPTAAESPSPCTRGESEQSELADSPRADPRFARLAQISDGPARCGEVAVCKRTPQRRSRAASEPANETPRSDSIRTRSPSPPELPLPVLPHARFSDAQNATPRHGRDAALRFVPDAASDAAPDRRICARRGPPPNRAAPSASSERESSLLEITHRAPEADRPKLQISKRADYWDDPEHRDKKMSAGESREADLASLLQFPAPAPPLDFPSAAREATLSRRGGDYFHARHAIRGRIRRV